MFRNEGHFIVIDSEFTAHTALVSVSKITGLLEIVPSIGGCGGSGHNGAAMIKKIYV
jgi:hypothetical protein